MPRTEGSRLPWRSQTVQESGLALNKEEKEGHKWGWGCSIPHLCPHPSTGQKQLPPPRKKKRKKNHSKMFPALEPRGGCWGEDWGLHCPGPPAALAKQCPSLRDHCPRGGLSPQADSRAVFPGHGVMPILGRVCPCSHDGEKQDQAGSWARKGGTRLC